jgi:flagellar secretion chaperone FliS
MSQNAMAHRANQAYRGAAVCVPPLKAMIMLLDRTISFLRKSMAAQEERRFEESFVQLTRATSILRGLSHNLDFARGGALAEQLYNTYNSLILACLRLHGTPRAPENFRRIIASLAQLREAWEFVDGAAAKALGPVAANQFSALTPAARR